MSRSYERGQGAFYRYTGTDLRGIHDEDEYLYSFIHDYRTFLDSTHPELQTITNRAVFPCEAMWNNCTTDYRGYIIVDNDSSGLYSEMGAYEGIIEEYWIFCIIEHFVVTRNARYLSRPLRGIGCKVE